MVVFQPTGAAGKGVGTRVASAMPDGGRGDGTRTSLPPYERE
jgi:hypothetical protein